MSSRLTSRPVRSLTRLYRIRSEVPAWNWLKWTVLSSVAVYTATGTLTRPNATEPVQIGRAITPPWPPRPGYPGPLDTAPGAPVVAPLDGVVGGGLPVAGLLPVGDGLPEGDGLPV